MYAAYLDESFDSRNDGFYAVASIVGDSWDVIKGEKLWSALLAKHSISTFKASKIRRPEILLEFATAIRDAGLFGCGMIASQQTVRKHLNGSILARQYRESPHMLLYHQTFVNIAMDFREHGSTESISFVCDENARYRDIMQRSYAELQELNPTSAQHMGSCSMANDTSCIPLQMADLLASELRRKSRTWRINDPTTEFSPALDLLLKSGAIWSVRRFDDRTLRMVRDAVDTRAARKKSTEN